MPLLIALFGLIAPRITILLLALFTSFMERAYDGLLIPLLGFIFLPLTTLTFAAAVNWNGGLGGTLWPILMVAAVLLDLTTGATHLGRRRKTVVVAN